MSEFDEVVENRLRKIQETLLLKAKEYASNDNRFHNFDLGARIMQSTPERALEGMMLKHIVSVLDLVEWAEVDENRITSALVDEKIGDTINYLILLEGILSRRIAMRKEK